MSKDELAPGSRLLDRFTIQKPIAEGGMASIYLARDEVTGRSVAVKALYDYYAENDVIRTRFLEEGRLQQLLRHPNIVHVFHVVEDPVLAFVMEHVDGPTLDDYLIQNGPLSEQDLVDIIIPVMSAVGFAHSKGVIHRDIKPSNILVEERGGIMVPKVMDFGVAKVQSAKRDLTATGTTVGTLHYMSPEQIVGSKKIDGRADIYSIGVTIYKLMTGEVPFNAPTEFALMMAQVEAPPLPPRQLREDMSRELEQVILKAMSKKASDRFESIKEFTQAILRSKSSRGEGVVADTMTDRIPAQILKFAMEADEIATDRTGEMDFSSVNKLLAASGFANDLALDELPTHELDRNRVRSKIQFPDTGAEATEEISALALKQITAEAEAMNASKGMPQAGSASAYGAGGDPDSTIDVGETVPIPSLAERLNRDETEENLRSTLETNEDDIQTLDDDEGRAKITRPSRPSAKLSQEQLDRLERDRDSARRSGVEVFDSQANSRDVTAPRMSETDYQKALENVRSSSEFLPEQAHSGQRQRPSMSGRRERVPVGTPDARQQSGPKMVIGKDYADTSDRTKKNLSSASVGLETPEPPPPRQPAPPLPPAPKPLSDADWPEPQPELDQLQKLADPTGERRYEGVPVSNDDSEQHMLVLLIAAIVVSVAAGLWILYLVFS
jgi:serine/threonine protein kinase